MELGLKLELRVENGVEIESRNGVGFGGDIDGVDIGVRGWKWG